MVYLFFQIHDVSDILLIIIYVNLKVNIHFVLKGIMKICFIRMMIKKCNLPNINALKVDLSKD